ncbi:MAG: CRISPR-associated endonuclease Cas1 [Verrucomicrobia bacterium]|nr:CRISPR-associated endonuclease Cas1 [Verrucomicrobiota bacterium]
MVNSWAAFLPASNAHGLARLRQYQRTRDPGFALQMSGRIITAKLYNQRRVLQRLAASRNYDLGFMSYDLKQQAVCSGRADGCAARSLAFAPQAP